MNTDPAAAEYAWCSVCERVFGRAEWQNRYWRCPNCRADVVFALGWTLVRARWPWMPSQPEHGVMYALFPAADDAPHRAAEADEAVAAV